MLYQAPGREQPDINFESQLGGGGGAVELELRLCYVQDYKTQAATAMILLGINQDGPPDNRDWLGSVTWLRGRLAIGGDSQSLHNKMQEITFLKYKNWLQYFSSEKRNSRNRKNKFFLRDDSNYFFTILRV